jgi:hypothetical protein
MPLFGLSSTNIQNMREKNDVDGLIKALDYKKSPNIRKLAAKALGEIKVLSTISNLMISVQNDDDESVRNTAFESMIKIGGRQAIEEAEKQLPDFSCRLCRILDAEHDWIKVEESLETFDAATRMIIINLKYGISFDASNLSQFSQDQILQITQFIHCKNSHTEYVNLRRKAIKLVDGFSPQCFRGNMLIQSLQKATSDPDNEICLGATKILRKIGQLPEADIIPRLLEATKDPDGGNKIEAEESIHDILRGRSIMDIIKGLKDASPLIKQISLKLLVEKSEKSQIDTKYMEILYKPLFDAGRDGFLLYVAKIFFNMGYGIDYLPELTKTYFSGGNHDAYERFYGSNDDSELLEAISKLGAAALPKLCEPLKY